MNGRNDQINEETTSSLINMRILDYDNASIVYDMLHGPQRWIVSLLILRSMIYYEVENDRDIEFDKIGAQ